MKCWWMLRFFFRKRKRTKKKTRGCAFFFEGNCGWANVVVAEKVKATGAVMCGLVLFAYLA